MVASKIGTEDIVNIGAYGKLTVILPDWAAVESVKNLVTRAKKRHPRPDGLTYTISTKHPTPNTISIETVKPENTNQKSKD